MKKAILFVAAVVCVLTAGAQKKPATVNFTFENLPTELLMYLDQATSQDDRKAANAKLIRAFEPVYKGWDEKTQIRYRDICVTMQKLRVKQFPDFAHFIEVTTLMSTQGKTNFAAWVDCLEYLQERNKKVKDFTDFVDFTEQLEKERILNGAKTSYWQTQAGAQYALGLEGKNIVVTFPKKMELYYSSDKDNGTIYSTTGKYYYFDHKWYGHGGRLNWDRTGLPTTVCWAELKDYEAVTKFPKFTADSVLFTNTKYFTQAIYGRVEEALSAQMDPDKYTYPKFRSYQKDFEMKNIAEGVDYSGSFMMNGSKFITSDSKHPASLLFRRGGKVFARVQSVKFTITSKMISAERAAVRMYLGEDSIYNDGIGMHYSIAERTVTFINDSKRNYYSPYGDSYHNLDLFSESIVWKMDKDELEFSMISSGGQNFSSFESKDYYSYARYRQLQGIEEVSPVMRVYRYMRDHGMTYEFKIDDFTKSISMDVSQARLMMHTLAKVGLVTYNEALDRVYVQDKLVDYAKAYNKNKDHDYDALMMESATKGANATIDLNNNELKIRGVEKFVVSDSQAVAISPRGDVTVHKNRDITFSGRVNIGRFVMYVTDATFFYEKFSLDLPKIDSLYFFVTDFKDPAKEHIVYTPLYKLVGEIQIDKPDNHNGLTKNKEYPIFDSKEKSFVYYDRPFVEKGVYKRDKFYYTLRPFTIRALSDFETDSLVLNGSLTSAGIFPEIVEPLKVQPDYSLGFVIKTGKTGMPAYGGKGTYHNTIDLSYKGFRGRGQLDYLTSVTKSKNIMFHPDSMMAVTDTFYVTEAAGFPDIRNGKTNERWYPYGDSMRVSQIMKGTPFKMYHDDALLAGHVTLRPKGATGGGVVTIKEGTLASNLFELKPMDMNSQVTEFTLRSLKHNAIAFHAVNMKSHVDYKTRLAEFTSNAPLERTELPVMNYAAYVDRFTWAIDKQNLALSNSKSTTSQGMESKPLAERVEVEEMPGATFVSTGSKQDSLKFNALKANYMYDLAEMKLDGIYRIDVADAAIAPGGDTLRIRKGGAIDHLKKSQILASRENKYHLVYNSDIQIASGKQYAAKGYIDYVDEDKKKQKIYLTDMAPNAKGMSVGNGFISDSANFTLSSAFGFAGKVRVEADSMFYHFDGGVRLLHKCKTDHEVGLLAYSDYTDPEDIRVNVPEIPTDWKGDRISSSILMSSTMMPYPAFLTKERAADNELMHAWGQLSYDNKTKTYMIASAKKQEDPEGVVDRYLKLNTEKCMVTGEGPVNFNMKEGLTHIFAYGDAMVNTSSSNFSLNTVFGYSFPLDDKVVTTMTQQIIDDLRLSAANTDNDLLRRALVFYEGEEKGTEYYSDYVTTGQFGKMPKSMENTLLFGHIDWQYSPVLGYYYDGVTSLLAIGKQQLNLATRVKMQLQTRGGVTKLTIYLQIAADHWYYFSYDSGAKRMTIQTSVGVWADQIKSIPADKRTVESKSERFTYKIGTARNEVPNYLLKFSADGNVNVSGGSFSDDEEEEEDEEETEEEETEEEEE